MTQVPLHERAATLAATATAPELADLLRAVAAEWSPGFADHDAPAMTRRMACVTPIGRALVALIEASESAAASDS